MSCEALEDAVMCLITRLYDLVQLVDSGADWSKLALRDSAHSKHAVQQLPVVDLDHEGADVELAKNFCKVSLTVRALTITDLLITTGQ